MQAQVHQPRPMAAASSSAIPYTDLPRRRVDQAAASINRRSYTFSSTSSSSTPSTCKSEIGAGSTQEWGMNSIAMENAVVVVSTKGCCMSHVVTRLLCSLGVNPCVVELEDEVIQGQASNIPAVFIGGRLLGGVDTLLAAHITGNLVPQLKEAGALWL